ncbi:MAG: undecaprenyl-diphosphate phosphatase [Blautia sp.]|nr:undecaprenyl-diphosphate phosphatase [Blautia sp.]
MTVIYVILLGILQGILEFLPVSSFGHVHMLERVFGIHMSADILFETMLHVGTLAAILYSFQKDVRRIAAETVGMAGDVLHNVRIYMNRRKQKEVVYVRVVNSVYRRFTFMLILTSIPTALLGFTARRLVRLSAGARFVPGICMLLTGVFLIVIDFSGISGKRTPRDAGYHTALWIGIFQGLSVFPGLSRMGLTVGTGILCGLSRRTAVRYSILASLPAVIGAMLVEAPSFAAQSVSLQEGAYCVLGMIAAGVTGVLAIQAVTKLMNSLRFRYFAVYCFIAGAAFLAIGLG